MTNWKKETTQTQEQLEIPFEELTNEEKDELYHPENVERYSKEKAIVIQGKKYSQKGSVKEIREPSVGDEIK